MLPRGMRRHIDRIDAVDHQRLARARVVANPQLAGASSHVVNDGIDENAAGVEVIADGLDIWHETLAAFRSGTAHGDITQHFRVVGCEVVLFLRAASKFATCFLSLARS